MVKKHPAHTAHIVFILMFCWCFAALFTALMAQYWGGLAPCILCHYQRYPYVAGLLVALVAALFWPSRWLAALGILCIAASGAVAVFHVGVEQQWWAGTNACAGTPIDIGQDPGSFIQALQTQPLVRCDRPAWTWAGISMTGYNLLYAVTGVGLLAYLARATRKGKVNV